jgi:hypothetical protein
MSTQTSPVRQFRSSRPLRRRPSPNSAAASTHAGRRTDAPSSRPFAVRLGVDAATAALLGGDPMLAIRAARIMLEEHRAERGLDTPPDK